MVVNYEVGPEYRRFNQKNNAIMRSNWDPLLNDYGERSQQAINKHIEKDDRGFGLDDFAFYTASRAVVSAFGTSVNGPNSGLTSWEPLSSSDARAVPDELKNGDRASPTELQSKVRRVARHLGADLVGFTPLDERWVYTNHFLPGKGADGKGENPPVELPEGCDQVVVLGFEMDHDMMATAPTAIMMTETGRNYSRMAAHTASLAQFIRAMGYTAVPSLNDTALNVPLAIDAGLAQPSRLGPAITPEFGERLVTWLQSAGTPAPPPELVEEINVEPSLFNQIKEAIAVNTNGTLSAYPDRIKQRLAEGKLTDFQCDELLQDIERKQAQ